ncbi:MAG: HAD family phosphatase [Thermoguttaceae bacterium]|jgi:FMN phosphatase YigB (HAD superfamily)
MPPTTAEPKFLYFDLGKVLVDYSVEQMCRQIATVSGIEPAEVADVLYTGGLQLAYETGHLSTRQIYDAFCARTATRPGYADWLRALSDIFTPDDRMAGVAAGLARAGRRMGILSNTCEAHWEHCFSRYAVLRESFSVYALSFRIGACKPAAAIFSKAAEMAGCRPEEIFYTDDMPRHVAGARAAGFDAVLFTSAAELTAELGKRGVRLDN